MFRSYSKRLLSPYSGQLQVVEGDPLRALTLDGRNWELQYRLPPDPDQLRLARWHGRSLRQRYVPIARFEGEETRRLALPGFFDRAGVDRGIDALRAHLQTLQLPLAAADHHEYWLLDAQDETPLALIFSCCRSEERALYPERAEWTALPAARMPIPITEEERQRGTPPVNYRLEGLVNQRAGPRPRAVWFDRRCGDTPGFPPLLVSEHWETDADRALCARYIQRQAPLLLMLHGLPAADRLRLEQAAREQVLEVARHFALYPAVADADLMASIRVEARLRTAGTG